MRTRGLFTRRRSRRRSRRLEAYRLTLPELTGRPRTPPISLTDVQQWVGQHWAALGLLALLALLGYWFFGTDQFYVYDAEITGTRMTTPEEIYTTAQLEGLSIFWVNPPAIARTLEQNPLIKQAVVESRLPNRVRIQIVEREPVAVWQSGAQSLYVDEGGALFPLRGDASQMVVIRDLRETPVEPGQQVDPEAVLTALELARLIPERRAFDWEPAAGVSFITEGGWRASFGDHSHLPIKAAAYRSFVEEVAPNEKVELLDLSAPEHPYYRVQP